MSEEITDEKTIEIIKLYKSGNLNEFKERLLNEPERFNGVFLYMLDDEAYKTIGKDLAPFLNDNFSVEIDKISERIYNGPNEIKYINPT